MAGSLRCLDPRVAHVRLPDDETDDLTIGLDETALHPPHGAYVEHLLLADMETHLLSDEAPVPRPGDADDWPNRR
jgi:hypothetical protein